MSELKGVEDTLFIPLVGRIYASKNFKEYFYDEKALALEQYIKDDKIKQNTGEYFTLASVSRFYEFDNLVKNFINKYENCNIICLGCGLETMYYRIKDERPYFYEVDFPDVIRQRRIALGEGKNEILIGSNILDYHWMDKVDKRKPSLVIVSGVFQYLHYEEVVNLIKALKEKFTNIEIAFDATNKMGIKGAEKYVKKTGNQSAMMYFYLTDIVKFLNDTGTKVINVLPFYKNATKILKKKLKLSTKLTCYFGDKMGFTKIIYLKIN